MTRFSSILLFGLMTHSPTFAADSLSTIPGGPGAVPCVLAKITPLDKVPQAKQLIILREALQVIEREIAVIEKERNLLGGQNFRNNLNGLKFKLQSVLNEIQDLLHVIDDADSLADSLDAFAMIPELLQVAIDLQNTIEMVESRWRFLSTRLETLLEDRRKTEAALDFLLGLNAGVQPIGAG